ncbi:MAG: hypothetical protein JWM74_3790, partial [Myxococcaceae bacterium]|nr:hypothetical protein [Myxococcaceae bacterium]
GFEPACEGFSLNPKNLRPLASWRFISLFSFSSPFFPEAVYVWYVHARPCLSAFERALAGADP